MTYPIAIVDYPDSFPIADRESYTITIDMGIVRDSYDVPVPHQRRKYSHQPAAISAMFKMSTEVFRQWEKWLAAASTRVVAIELAHPWMQEGSLTEITPVSVIGRGISLNYSAHNVVSASIDFKVSPVVYADFYEQLDSLDPEEDTWPAAFPKPDVSAYSFQGQTGMRPMVMEAGTIRNREIYGVWPHQYSLMFYCNTAMLRRVIAWMNQYGYDWFNMPSVSQHLAISDVIYSNIPVRFIGDVEIQSAGYDYWTISAPAEFNVDMLNGLTDDDFVIAGRPIAPSADWVIAGAPSIPSDPDWVFRELVT